MPLPVISGVYRCVLNWSNGTQLAENILHVFSSVPSDPASAVANALATAISANTNAFVGTQAASVIYRIDVTPLDGVTATYERLSAISAPAANTGDFIPAASMLCKFQTALRGPSHRGRIYTPFIAESKQSNGVMVSGSDSTMATAWGNIQTALQAGSRNLSVASYVHAESHIVTAFVGENTLGTQRRRQTRLRS
jgi:hypothetical protein